MTDTEKEQWYVQRHDGSDDEDIDGTNGYINYLIIADDSTQIARIEEGTYPDGELLRARRDAALIVALHNAAPALRALRDAAKKLSKCREPHRLHLSDCNVDWNDEPCNCGLPELRTALSLLPDALA